MATSAKIKSATVLAATAAATLGQAIPAAQADPTAHRTPASKVLVTWKNGKTGHYLTVLDGSKSRGADVTTNPTDGSKQQHWYMVLEGSSIYQVQNENSGLCMDPLGNHLNYDVDQSGCGDVWGEHALYNNHGVFIGSYSLTVGGGTVSVQGHLCENTTTHGLYTEASFPVYGSNEPENCRWH